MEPVTDLVVDLGRLGVALGGLAMVLHLVVYVPEAVQGVGFAGAVADLAMQFQCALAARQRLAVLAEVRVDPADTVLDDGQGGDRAHLLDDPERFPRVH